MSETTVTNVTTGGRSGIGAAPLTVSVSSFNPLLGCDSATFQSCSERALSSLKFLIDAYRKHYPINKDIPSNQPVLIGRFLSSEEGFDDTLLFPPCSINSASYQAQYFSTFNSTEQLYDAVSHVEPHRRTQGHKANFTHLPAVRPGRQNRHVPPWFPNV